MESKSADTIHVTGNMFVSCQIKSAGVFASGGKFFPKVASSEIVLKTVILK